jgi:hypothetical protein
MNYTLGVGIAHGLTHLLEDSQKTAILGRWIGSLAEKLSESLAFDQLHDQERPAVCQCANLMHWRYTGVLKLTCDLSFREKSPRRRRIRSVSISEQLDSDITIQRNVTSTVNNSHSAVANLFLQLVAGNCRWRFVESAGAGNRSVVRIGASLINLQESVHQSAERLNQFGAFAAMFLDRKTLAGVASFFPGLEQLS